MRRLHLVRHGESTWNAAGRLQGATAHVPLTARGRAQAGRAAVAVVEALAGRRCAALLSSDLLRARQTADVVAVALGAGVRIEIALREQAQGRLEGELVADLVAQPVPAGEHVAEVRWGGPGSESLADVHHRLTALADRWPAGPGDVVCVSHGDAIRVLLAVLAGRGPRDVDWVEVPAGSVRTVPLG